MNDNIREKKFLNILKYICNFFCPKLPLYGALLVIQSIQLFISYYLINQIGIGLIFGTIAWAYVLTLPQKLFLTKGYRGIYESLAITLSSLLGLLELFCAIKMEELVSSTHILLILYSNANESIEFVSTYVDWKFIWTVIFIAILAIFIYQLFRKIKSCHIIITVISLLAISITTVYGIWFDCGIGRVIYAIDTFGDIKSYNLRDTQPIYDVCETSSLHPNIILIIGESFDRNHSSLYGYDKDTNPLLLKRWSDSTMVVIEAISAGANTHLSIRQMLSLAESSDDELWYEKPVLLTALSKSGYHTCWLSNQPPSYNSDNLLGSFARLCDQYINTSKVNFYDNSYDEVLFIPFFKYVDKTKDSDHNFCVIHLTGSHFRYDARYPKKYEYFTKYNYTNQKENRRGTFASYDNSILYNDFVVDSLMKISDSLDAIVIYSPDHGQDFYYTRDVASHSFNDPESLEAGCQIPFMIYFTKLFRDKHPEIVERTRTIVLNNFNTKYLMNTIMDIAGYDICGSSIYDNSIFKGNFSPD